MSDLSHAVAAALGPDALIFPASLDAEHGRASVANKILARLEGDPAQAAELARTAMCARLAEHWERLANKLRGSGWLEASAKRQIDDLIEFNWVAVRYTGEPAYAGARKKVEALLAARKNSRDWRAVTWGAPVPKSALDGLRESVIPEDVFDRRHESYLAPEALWGRFRVRKGERLCGVGLLKRWGSSPERDENDLGEYGARRPIFHSASHVAAAPLLTRMKRLGREDVLRRYFDELRTIATDASGRDGLLSEHRIRAQSGRATASSPFDKVTCGDVPLAFPFPDGGQTRWGIDGYLLFEDRMPEVLEVAGVPEDKEEKARGAARERLRGALRGLGWDRPVSPYYALLLADGDFMGKAIDGLGQFGAHQKLSQQLHAFAVGCRDVVERHGGSLIYSGGDDVLALLPLHTALASARDLHEQFEEKLGPACQGLKKVPTLSVGLALCHHMQPFAEAREQAKAAEKLAKTHDTVNKNGLAVVVDKRSGDTLEWACSWKDGPVQRLERWVKLLFEDAIPDSVAYELEREVTRLRFDDEAEGQDLAGAVEGLVDRVLARRRAQRGQATLDESVRAEIAARLGPGADLWKRVLALSAEIQISRTLLEGYRMAWEDRR